MVATEGRVINTQCLGRGGGEGRGRRESERDRRKRASEGEGKRERERTRESQKRKDRQDLGSSVRDRKGRGERVSVDGAPGAGERHHQHLVERDL